MKLSSTHSFKGFESPFIVLLVSSKDSPEVVYTGLTRAKENLVVFLEEDGSYTDFFSKHLNKLEVDCFAESPPQLPHGLAYDFESGPYDGSLLPSR
jgi:hypothetical protein